MAPVSNETRPVSQGASIPCVTIPLRLSRPRREVRRSCEGDPLVLRETLSGCESRNGPIWDRLATNAQPRPRKTSTRTCLCVANAAANQHRAGCVAGVAAESPRRNICVLIKARRVIVGWGRVSSSVPIHHREKCISAAGVADIDLEVDAQELDSDISSTTTARRASDQRAIWPRSFRRRAGNVSPFPRGRALRPGFQGAATARNAMDRASSDIKLESDSVAHLSRRRLQSARVGETVHWAGVQWTARPENGESCEKMVTRRLIERRFGAPFPPPGRAARMRPLSALSYKKIDVKSKQYPSLRVLAQPCCIDEHDHGTQSFTATRFPCVTEASPSLTGRITAR